MPSASMNVDLEKDTPRRNKFFSRISDVAFPKTVDGIRKAFRSKFRYVLIGFLALVFLYLVYFAFSYKEEPAFVDKGQVYWNDFRMVGLRLFVGLAIVSLIVYGIYRYAKGSLSIRGAAILFCLIAALVIMTYSFTTPIYNYSTTFNQHDVYYGSTNSQYYMEDLGIVDGGGGHFGLIMTVYRYNIIPEIIKRADGTYDFTFSGVLERYQPKTFYFISGWFMRFNSIFIHASESVIEFPASTGIRYDLTKREWALYESLRILYVAIEWLQLYFIYKIFVRLKINGRGRLIAFGLVAFCPIWCFFAHWTNNDGMSTFFEIVALYYAIKYVQESKWHDIILTALGIGLSMSCKLGGALIAFIVGPMLVYSFVKSILRSRKGQRLYSTGKLPEWLYVSLQILVFAIIVFPIGLFWPLYNNIRFGQPITFFSEVGNKNLYIVNESFFERFILYPNADVFRSIFVYHSNANPEYVQDTSLITALIKTSLYGEYGFGKSSVQLCALYVFANLIATFSIVLAIMRIVLCFIEKKEIDWFRFAILMGICVVFYGWAVYFVASYPYTCNEDIRYIAPLILAFAGFLGLSYNRLCESSCKPVKMVGKAIPFLSIGFAASVIVAYLTLTPWYYRP